MISNMFLLPYRERTVWTSKYKKYINSHNIKEQVWEHDGVRLNGYCMSIKDIIKYITEHPTDCKEHRHKLLRFNSKKYPVKEFTDFKDSSFVVFVDIDDHPDGVDETILHKLSDEQFEKLYEELYWYLVYEHEHNFLYMEKSSSGHGMHLMFYYDFDEENKTEQNFQKCAIYTKKIFFEDIEKGIKDFTKLISEPKVFDKVYNRPWQACYLTGKDYKFNDCDGLLPDDFDDVTSNITEKSVDRSNYQISDIRLNGKIEAPYDLCLKIYTAIKRVTRSKEECEHLWDEVNRNHIINNKYNYNDRKRWFRYEGIDESTAHVELLERLGIKIDRSTQHFYLSGDKYLGDIRETILGNVTNGITLLQAGTGVGKTRCWTDLNKKILEDELDLPYHKPIIVIEPLNSIINTKYNDDVVTITGSKRFPKDLSQYSMYVTNYNKLIHKTIEGNYELRNDIVEFFNKFELVIIDESHIIIKDSFRCDVLIPFIDTIKQAAKQSKIILQTATPMEESKLCDITNNITVHKEVNRNCKYIFRKILPKIVNGKEVKKFCIQDLNCLIGYYIDNKRKVYVYWNNGSLTQQKELQYALDGKYNVAVYHKRNSGSVDMERINKWHVLDSRYNKDCDEEYNYDVLISSVYFGVGNDLNDDCDAAVIIIGNNAWQEDIQAVGRWRNSKDIEVCQVILPNEDLSFDDYEDYDTILKQEKIKLRNLWHDKLNKDKSVIIAHKAYQINKEEDIEKLAVMKASNIYNSFLKVKTDKFSDVYYNIVVKYDLDKYIISNEDYTKSNKNYWDEISDVRNKDKQRIIKEGKNFNDYHLINADSDMDRWFKLYKHKLVPYKIDKILGPKYICAKSHYNLLNVFCMYYQKFLYGIDLPELYALLWYRNNYEKGEYSLISTPKYDSMIVDTIEIKNEDWFSALAYMMFIRNNNILEDAERLKASYYKTFKWYCKLFYEMPQELIDMFYNNTSADEQTMKFFGANKDEWDNDFFEEIHSTDDIKKYIETNKNYSQKQIEHIISICLNLPIQLKIESGKIGGKIGGKNSSPKKKCTITDKIKESMLSKYNITIGQEFDSCEHLAKYVNKSLTSISQWRSKGWIE